MNSNLKNRLLRGFGANGLSQIITVVIQVLSVPIFLQSWGQELYGEWLIISAIPTYISMSDIGFTTAAANDMTMNVARGKKSAALEVFQSIWLLISSISLVIIIIAVSVVYLLPVSDWLNLTELNQSEVKGVILLLTLYVLMGMQRNLIVAGFRCDGNYALGVTYASLLRLFEYGILVTFVSFGASPDIAALSFLISSMLGIFSMKITLSCKSQWLLYGYKYASLNNLKKLAKPAIASMSFPLGNAISNQGIIIAIGSTLGATNVVIFSTLRTLSRLALQVMGMIKNSVSPEISAAYASNEMTLARKLHRHACQLSLWMALLTVVILGLLGERIVTLWTRNIISFDRTLFFLMLAIVVISSFWFTSLTVLTSTNNHQKVSIYYLIATITSLILAVILLKKLGLNGAVIALIFTEILMSFYVVRNSLILLKDDFTFYFKTVSRPPLFFK